MVLRVFVAFVVVLIGPALASGQTGIPGAPRAGLTVSVLDADGRGVPGATVAVRDASGGTVSTVTTAADGVARIQDLAPGGFDVRATAPGFADAATTASVATGQLIAIQVTLARTAGAPDNSNAVPRPPGIATPAGEDQTASPANPGIPARRGLGDDPVGAIVPLPPDEKVFVPLPDRWNISMPDWDRYGVRGDYPYVGGHWWDPYNRNTLKGDYPILGDRTFFVFTGVSDTLLEGRNLPVAGAPAAARPFGEPFFGRGDQYLPVAVFRTSFDLFRGDTAFRPVDWRVRVQPAVSVNYLHRRDDARSLDEPRLRRRARRYRRRRRYVGRLPCGGVEHARPDRLCIGAGIERCRLPDLQRAHGPWRHNGKRPRRSRRSTSQSSASPARSPTDGRCGLPRGRGFRPPRS